MRFHHKGMSIIQLPEKKRIFTAMFHQIHMRQSGRCVAPVSGVMPQRWQWVAARASLRRPLINTSIPPPPP